MKRLTELLKTTELRAERLLDHAQKYLAHIPKPGDPHDKKVETLGEHLDLVLDHAQKIVSLHDLDAVVDRLVGQVVHQLKFVQPEPAANWITTLFVNTIVFHDFGVMVKT